MLLGVRTLGFSINNANLTITQVIVGNFDLSPLVKRDTGKLTHIQKQAKSKRLQKSWVLKHFYFRLRILNQFKVYANTPKSEKL